jgi:serine/threonine protein kinase
MFSENYSVCLNDDGSPREIERNGPVVTYKAIGYETGRMVAMQLIPLSSMDEVERVRFEENARTAQKLDHINLVRVFDVGIEHDHLVLVTEYLEGETVESWIRAHGPMPAEAVLRIGLQVMNALTAAAIQSLTHRSIQPANVMILPGVASDGGWPGIKLLNFGFAGLKMHSEDDQIHEIVPSMPLQFASPEQLENGIVDFRSDIFSLGATMWFLLTGAAPPPAAATESGPRLSTSVGAVPRFVRNLVSRMLRTNPEERPQDPATFAEKIHACLQKAERQTAFTRSFAPAAIPTLPRAEKKRVAPALALAASVAVLASLGAFYFVRSQRESKPLGVIIGVPETAEASSLLVGAPSPPSPVISPAAEQSGLVAQQSPMQNASPAATSVTADKLSSSPQLAANNRMAEPPAPAEGPSETSQASISVESPSAEKNESPPSGLPDRTAMAAKDSAPATTAGNEPTNSSEHVASTRKRDDSSASKTKARRQRFAKSARPLPPLRVGAESARVVGATSNGNWVLRLPSGETIVTPPVPNIDDAPVISHRRVRRVLRPIPLQDEPPVMVLPPDF